MKLLIITHLIPYPLSDGGRISQYALIDYLRKKCSITLLVFVHGNADETALLYLKERWQDVVFDVISLRPVLPQEKKRSAKSLIQSGVKALLHQANKGYDNIYPALDNQMLSDEEAANENLINLVDFIKPKFKKTIEKIAASIERFKPDIIQVEFVYLLDLVLCLPADIKRIFIHHELRFMRIETEMAAQKQRSSSYADYLKKLCEISEIELLKGFDAVVTMSDDDKKLLVKKLPSKKIYSSPFPILDREIIPIKRENLVVKKLVFVGGELHAPNKDAVEWYIDSMAKMAFEKFAFTLHVIGNWSLETISRYKNNPAVVFSGYVENLSDYLSNSIMLVPLRIGSGIRQKILYAVAAGIPVISTTIGSEGIQEHDKICVRADTPSEFVDMIAKIIDDCDFTEKLVSTAQMLLRKYYSQEVAGNKRLELYQSVLELDNFLPTN